MQPVEAEPLSHSCDERLEIRLPAITRSDADLRGAMARYDPADVTRRKLAIGKAMQEARIDFRDGLAFDFRPHEKSAISPQTELFRHGGTRPIRADEEACL